MFAGYMRKCSLVQFQIHCETFHDWLMKLWLLWASTYRVLSFYLAAVQFLLLIQLFLVGQSTLESLVCRKEPFLCWWELLPVKLVCSGLVSVASSKSTRIGRRDMVYSVDRDPSWTWFRVGSLHVQCLWRKALTISCTREIKVAARYQLQCRRAVAVS